MLFRSDTEQTMSIAATTENIEEAFSIEMPVEAETKEIHKANSPKDKGTKKETHEDTEQPYRTNYCRTDSANPDRDKDSKIETDVGSEEELTNVEEAIQLSPKHKDMSTVSAATVMAEQKPEEIEKEVTDDQQTIAETTSSIQLEKHLEEKIETDKSNTDRKETELISGRGHGASKTSRDPKTVDYSPQKGQKCVKSGVLTMPLDSYTRGHGASKSSRDTKTVDNSPRKRQKMREITSFDDAARVMYRGSRGIEILRIGRAHV